MSQEIVLFASKQEISLFPISMIGSIAEIYLRSMS